MIFIECFPDEFIVKHLGVKRKQIKHSRSKSRVITDVGKESGNALGMVDEDPDSPFPSELNNYKHNQKEGDIVLLIRQGYSNKKIIKLKPRLEAWLYKRARSNKIDPQDYSLPPKANDLHNIPHYEKLPKFKKFLTAITDSGDKEINTLKKWLDMAEQ